MGETALAMALQGDLDCLIAIIEATGSAASRGRELCRRMEGLRIWDAQIELIGNRISVLGNMLQLSAGMGAFGSRRGVLLTRSGCGRSCRGHHGSAADSLKPRVPGAQIADPALLPSSAICAQPRRPTMRNIDESAQVMFGEAMRSKQSTTCSRWAENRRIMGAPLPGPYGFRFIRGAAKSRIARPQ